MSLLFVYHLPFSLNQWMVLLDSTLYALYFNQQQNDLRRRFCLFFLPPGWFSTLLMGHPDSLFVMHRSRYAAWASVSWLSTSWTREVSLWIQSGTYITKGNKSGISTFINLFYQLIAQEDFSLVVTFPWNFKDLCISLGQESYSGNDYLLFLRKAWNKSSCI